jgi:hypothetical protein
MPFCGILLVSENFETQGKNRVPAHYDRAFKASLKTLIPFPAK